MTLVMNWAFASAGAVCRALRTGALTAEDYLDLLIDRHARHNGAINAIVALDVEAARERARQADRERAAGRASGPLHGLPMTIKESFEVVGMPCCSGSPTLQDHRPQIHADAVQRLVDAGAIPFGKTNVPLFTGDLQSYNAGYGTTNNPWDTTKIPGGSSGGAAAAVAAGLTPLELGSDIGGSIRNPAHFCGVYGHKPSYGIVPLRGHIPGKPGALGDMDIAVAGPLARSADDLALALNILAGPGPREAAAWHLTLPPARAKRLADFRVAVWLDEADYPIDQAVGAALQAAVDRLAKAGASIATHKPQMDMGVAFETYYQLLAGAMAKDLPTAMLTNFAARLTDDRAEPDTDNDTGAGADAGADTGDFRDRFMRGASQTHAQWLQADEIRQRLRAQWADFFTEFDVLLCPVAPTTAFAHDQNPDIYARTVTINGTERPYLSQVFWAGVFGLAGLPATVAPVGPAADGLPVGLQIVGPYLEDMTPIAFARAASECLGGFRRPPGFE